VCDGTKHLHLDKPHTKVSNSGMRQGAFSKAFSRAFDIGGLFLTLHDGTKLYFDNVADKVLSFWKNFLRMTPTSQSSLHAQSMSHAGACRFFMK
jgi:hypothetical protein